ncbi:MAG: hypothetical protein AAF570_20405, partial [Bacteroidota bacterium]
VLRLSDFTLKGEIKNHLRVSSIRSFVRFDRFSREIRGGLHDPQAPRYQPPIVQKVVVSGSIFSGKLFFNPELTILDKTLVCRAFENLQKHGIGKHISRGFGQVEVFLNFEE